MVTARMQSANAAGLNLARIWGHGDGTHILQTGPGIYDPRVFRALDYVVAKAHDYNIKVRPGEGPVARLLCILKGPSPLSEGQL